MYRHCPSVELQQPRGQRNRNGFATAAIAPVALVLFTVAVVVFHQPPRSLGGPVVRKAVAEELTQLSVIPAGPAAGMNYDPNDPCAEYPYLKFLNVSYNNLGGHGPDQGPEGLIWKTLDLGTGARNMTGRPVDLMAHVIGDYRVWEPYMNGMSGQFGGKSGQFGSLNLIAGSSMTIEFSFRDALTNAPVVMPELAMTWYDLDQDQHNTCREQVVAAGFKTYTLSQNTEIIKTVLPDGSMAFQSSTFGDGDDNPTDPLHLTQQQRNRAVSFEYENVRTVRFTLSAASGTGARFFTFVGRPALLCSLKNEKERQEQTIGNVILNPLVAGPGMVPVKSPANAAFHRWMVGRGDLVPKGEPMAEIWVDGELEQLTAPKKGVVVSMQDELKDNDTINTRLGDGTIAMVGFLPPLPKFEGQDVVRAPPGSLFKKFTVRKANFVYRGDPVAVVSVGGEDHNVNSPRDGIVVSTQDVLQEGDPVDGLCLNRMIAVVGKLSPLKTNSAIQPVRCHINNGRFWEWKRNLGDSVNKGDEIAIVKSDLNGSKITVSLTAPKSGVVNSLQERLKQGTNISELLSDHTVATIGPFPPLNYTGTQECVRVPLGSTFIRFETKVGDTVQEGDPIARVALPGIRRLSVGPLGGSDTLSSVAINSPRAGTVIAEQHLDPGMPIDDAIDGSVIAVVGDAQPMWLWWLLGALAACLLLLTAFLCCCLRGGGRSDNDKWAPLKNKQDSRSILAVHHSSLPEPEEEEGPRPPGLRLVWADNEGERRIAYSQYRPLGIRMQHVCPIVIEDFKFNSYAKQQLEVERGWELLRVGDIDMSTTTEFGRARDILNEHQRSLPVWPLRLDFEDPKTKQARTFHFAHKPIGIEFTNKAPITVKKVYENSPASNFKVQTQWVITRIGSQVKAQELDFAVLMRLLKEGVEPLGEWEARDRPDQGQPGQQQSISHPDDPFDRATTPLSMTPSTPWTPAVTP